MGRQGIAPEAGVKSMIAAIVLQASKDYSNPQVVTGYKAQDKNMEKNRLKKSALHFLISEDCKYMCDVLDVDYGQLIKSLGVEG